MERKEWTHDEIVKFMADITPGSWEKQTEIYDNDIVANVTANGAFVVGLCGLALIDHDAEFIAAAPDIVRSLLAEVERLQAENERLERDVKIAQRDWGQAELELHALKIRLRSLQAD